jgi:hypothetical protein
MGRVEFTAKTIALIVLQIASPTPVCALGPLTAAAEALWILSEKLASVSIGSIAKA